MKIYDALKELSDLAGVGLSVSGRWLATIAGDNSDFDRISEADRATLETLRDELSSLRDASFELLVKISEIDDTRRDLLKDVIPIPQGKFESRTAVTGGTVYRFLPEHNDEVLSEMICPFCFEVGQISKNEDLGVLVCSQCGKTFAVNFSSPE